MWVGTGVEWVRDPRDFALRPPHTTYSRLRPTGTHRQRDVDPKLDDMVGLHHAEMEREECLSALKLWDLRRRPRDVLESRPLTYHSLVQPVPPVQDSLP